MPILKSYYNPPLIFKNGHFSTVYSGILRIAPKVLHQRERITLKDGDFIDIDWSFSKTETSKLIIILHGLEGNSTRAYMTGTAKLFNENGYDAMAVNFRSCSGEMNLLYRSYTAGASEDLEEIITFVLNNYPRYDHIIIKGFSLGGNVTLKYLGEHTYIPSEIKAAIAVSVPCYLKGSLEQMTLKENYVYYKQFIINLKDKLMKKQQAFPDLLSLEAIKKANTMRKIDDLYSSKAHGYKDAIDYYTKASSLQFLPNIKIPTLIINAQNDSFLSEECYPKTEAKQNKNLYLEIPKYGGHVGFYESTNIYYNEKRALAFATSV